MMKQSSVWWLQAGKLPTFYIDSEIPKFNNQFGGKAMFDSSKFAVKKSLLKMELPEKGLLTSRFDPDNPTQ